MTPESGPMPRKNNAIFVGVLFAGLTSGCADQEESLIVRNVAAWTDGACVIDPDTEMYLLRGRLDLAFGTPYLTPIILENQLPPRDPEISNPGIDTNEIQLRDVDVELSMPQAPEVLEVVRAQNEAFVSFTQTLASDSLPSDSRAGVGVETISGPASLAFRDAILAAFPADVVLTVEANFVFHGLRSGNSKGNVGVVDAREYTFPITLCIGCLVDCAGCEPLCSGNLEGFICGNAQDTVLRPADCDEFEPGSDTGG